MQREGNHRDEVRSCAFVVIVGIAELESVKVRECLASAFDADEMAEFVRNHVRNPTMAAADFKIPVGKPEVHCVFARDGASVAIERIVQDGADSPGERLVVTACNGIVDGFGVGGYLGRVRGIFHRINELEMLRTYGFPF